LVDWAVGRRPKWPNNSALHEKGGVNELVK